MHYYDIYFLFLSYEHVIYMLSIHLFSIFISIAKNRFVQNTKRIKLVGLVVLQKKICIILTFYQIV